MVKPYRKKDPHWKREASLYKHPVASREHIIQYMEEVDRPLSFAHLSRAFQIQHSEEQEGLRRRLIAMVRDGQIISNRRGSYALVDKMDLVRGRVQLHRDGFGFLLVTDDKGDIFLPAREMRMVFNSDVVLVRVTNPGEKRREGAIVEVLERNTHQIAGRYFEERGVAFISPDSKLISQDVLIPRDQRGKALPGEFVVVEITDQPTKRRQAMGKVIEVLGDQLTPGMEIELAVRAHDLPFQWPPELLREVKQYSREVLEAEKRERVDCRHLPLVTIDGDDAKDFDDAVYCEPLPKGGYKLYVAIADVSHYVLPDSILDIEAEKRGNSVYFPAKVIPMLPEILSNNLCSLKPKKDRLAMVCEMQFNAKANMMDYQFYPAVIHSHARLTYNQVAEMLAGKVVKNSDLLPHLKNLESLYKKLIKQRNYRGALEFETTETRIEFNKKGKIKRIVPVMRNEAHRIIEECMLAANVAASQFLEKNALPTLYRIHETPDSKKLHELRQFLRGFGLRLTGGDEPTPNDYGKLIARITSRADAHLLQTVLLRSLKQATYSPDNMGHFGLAYDGYCHFTSPIRRFPDLIVHRGIKFLLQNQRKPKRQFKYDHDTMASMGEHFSMTERRADRATRDALDWLKCEYMLHKLGETFDGHIVDVTSFGVFVELKDIYVEGLVHVTALPNDYYHFDPQQHSLRGKRGGQLFRLGDSLRIVVARIDIDQRKIDFVLPEDV